MSLYWGDKMAGVSYPFLAAFEGFFHYRPLIFIGAVTCLITIVIHCWATVLVVRFARHRAAHPFSTSRNVMGLYICCVVTLVFFLAHMLEMVVWALCFLLIGQFRNFEEAFYHSAVNYTTLGYGDTIMQTPWHILGPLEATAGVLAFGLSTAALSTMIMRTVEDLHGPLQEHSAGELIAERGRDESTPPPSAPAP